jgi:hypothetical protein
VRHGASTVVVLAGLDLPGGPDREELLAALGRATNVSVVRAAAGDDPLAAAAAALREASRRSSSYALVVDDPLAAVAAEWQAMWDVSSAGAGGGAPGFERRAAQALSSWRAGGFELPDYYLVLAPAARFHLGPLRAARPHRVAIATPPGTAGDVPGGRPPGTRRAVEVLRALGSLEHGPWWPPLDELIEVARGFYPGTISPATAGSAAGLADAAAGRAADPR